MTLNVSQIYTNGWLQGGIFPSAASNHISESVGFPCGESRWVVISQSCDVRSSRQDESAVEILLITPIQREENDKIGGRHPRICHFAFTNLNDTKEWFEAKIENRFRIDRNFCAVYAPDNKLLLPDDVRKDLIRWITYRYTRTAFPDEFNRRMHNQKNALKELLKKGESANLSGIYLCIHDIELPSEVKYDVKILGTVEKRNFDKQYERSLAEKLIGKFEATVSKCPKITVSSECDSEENVSIHKMRFYSTYSTNSVFCLV